MHDDLRIDLLADHPEVLPLLAEWFRAEWPGYYGPGGAAEAAADLRASSNRDRLPIGVVALRGDGTPCGTGALKAESIATHRHLGPWLAAGLVHSAHRGRGIGAALVRALEDVARSLSHARIYCATATASGLVERAGFVFLDRVAIDDALVSVYEKAL